MRVLLITSFAAALLAGCGSGSPEPEPAPKTPEPVVKDVKPDAAPATIALEIEGMHCDSCAGWVQDILEDLDGVAGAEVSLQKHSAIVTMKPGATFPEAAARDELDKENYKLKAVTTKTAN